MNTLHILLFKSDQLIILVYFYSIYCHYPSTYTII
nr:MAG TPA: hypothetical protein [Bacteriophage sp.]